MDIEVNDSFGINVDPVSIIDNVDVHVDVWLDTQCHRHGRQYQRLLLGGDTCDLIIILGPENPADPIDGACSAIGQAQSA